MIGYAVGDRIRVVRPWGGKGSPTAIRMGEEYTCLAIHETGFVRIDNGHCDGPPGVSDGYFYDRFEKVRARYMIQGGVHTDTSFTTIVPGTEESYGPFDDYDHTVNVWRGKMGRMIDTCEHRLFIVEAA